MTKPNDPSTELAALAAKPSLEFRRRDADGDGVITPEEFTADDPSGERMSAFERYDANKDGVLTDAELKEGRRADRGQA